MKNALSLLAVGVFSIAIILGLGMVFGHAQGMHGTRAMTNARSGHHGMMGSMGGMMNRMHRWMHGDSNQIDRAKENPADTKSKVVEAQDKTSNKQTFRIETAFDNGLIFRGSNEVNPTLRMQVGKTVEIRLENSIGSRHDLVIPGLDAESEVLNRRGETTTFSFVPEKTGQFTYYCSIPGHRQAGMEGKIIVEGEGN